VVVWPSLKFADCEIKDASFSPRDPPGGCLLRDELLTLVDALHSIVLDVIEATFDHVGPYTELPPSWWHPFAARCLTPRPKINLTASTLCPAVRAILKPLPRGRFQPFCPRQVGCVALGVSPGIASLRDADSQRVEYPR
jgi:hypothetical protein